MSFWDSSALVPLCTNEPRSVLAGRLWKQFPQKFVWWETSVEICSALARLERENLITLQKRLNAENASEFLKKFGRKFSRLHELENLPAHFPRNTK